MKRIIFTLFSCFFLAQSALALANPPQKGPNELLLHQADYLKKVGEWDLAEKKFLLAVKSPRVAERIEALQGLEGLYQLLQAESKLTKAREQLAAEKAFQRKLVPKWDSYYTDYVVQENDTYGKIARRHQISLEWLLRVNKHRKLRAGRTIRLPQIHYRLEINKSEKALTWKRGSEILKIYSIAIGQIGMDTPEGDFKITNKVKNPAWYGEGEVLPPDSPENLLGTRWMGLNQKGYGIHGTRIPESIGQAASHGCIRMYNQDVEELFQWVPIGTTVTILPTT